MPATTKAALLDVTQGEFAKLDRLIDGIGERAALAKDDDDTSIKDVVAHRAHWIALFRGWYEDGLAGRPVFFPAEGYKWNELKRYNADLRDRQAGLSWDEARVQLRAAHTELIAFLTAASDRSLYGGAMVGANNHWTPGRWAEAAGASHYRSAAKYIRARMRAVPGS